MLDETELWVLSYYRASELAGALLFGTLARRTPDSELAVYLTRHFAEEARHAWMWTETIRELGHLPVPIMETYQSQYAREAGIPASMGEVLILTQVFEERIYSHFSRHATRPGVQPEVKRTLEVMLAEEEGHLDWVRKWLEKDGRDYSAVKQRYREIDERIYRQALPYEQRLWDFLKRTP